MKASLFLLSLLGLVGRGLCQHHVADSLRERISVYGKEDTVRVNLFIQLSSEETYDHPTLAGHYAIEAKSLAEKLNYPAGIALGYRFMGAAFWSQANHSSALANFLKGLKIADSIPIPQVQADLTGNLGMVYSDLGDYRKALMYYRLSLKKQVELGNVLRQAVMHINIGNGFYHLNQFDSALAFYQKGLTMMAPFIKTSRSLIDLGTIGVGDAYAGLGNFEEALKYYRKAKTSSDTTRHNRGRAHSRISLANLYIKMRQYQKAEKELLECLAITKSVNLKTYVRDSYELLANVTALQNRQAQSYQYFKLYAAYKDSIQNLAETSKIASLQLDYEIQRKQIEINNLKKDAALSAKELKLKNTILLSVVIGTLLVMLLLFITIKNFRNQKTLNDLLHTQNLEILNQKAELAKQQDEVVYQRDILEEKNRNIELLNKQVIESNQNLEKTVSERTAALKQQNSQLEKYAFINAHKLRAPVATIMGLINLLQKEVSPHEQKEIIQYLKKSSNNLDQVVRSISDTLHKGIDPKSNS